MWQERHRCVVAHKEHGSLVRAGVVEVVRLARERGRDVAHHRFRDRGPGDTNLLVTIIH